MNLIKNVKISSAITPTAGAAATTDIEGSVVDMLGFRGCLIKVRFGEITGSAVTSIKAQHGDAAAMGDAADLEGTGQTIADTDDDKIFYIDIYRPTKRYLRLYVDRATQNAVVAEASYIQYEPVKAPTSQGTNVAGELHISPVAGTA